MTADDAIHIDPQLRFQILVTSDTTMTIWYSSMLSLKTIRERTGGIVDNKAELAEALWKMMAGKFTPSNK